MVQSLPIRSKISTTAHTMMILTDRIFSCLGEEPTPPGNEGPDGPQTLEEWVNEFRKLWDYVDRQIKQGCAGKGPWSTLLDIPWTVQGNALFGAGSYTYIPKTGMGYMAF